MRKRKKREIARMVTNMSVMALANSRACREMRKMGTILKDIDVAVFFPRLQGKTRTDTFAEIAEAREGETNSMVAG